MKKIISLALVALSLTALPAVANNSDVKDSKTCTEQTCRKGAPAKCKAASAFEGLQLTDSQKEQIKALGTKQAEQAKEARGQKMRNDSTARVARMEARKGYLNDLKSILGPEKYVQFLENSYLYGKDGGRHGKMDKKARHGKMNGQMKGKRAHSPERPLTPQAL